MKRCGLVSITCSTILLSCLVLPFGLRSFSRAADHADDQMHFADPTLSSSAAWKWRNSQTRHWRNCMLQN